MNERFQAPRTPVVISDGDAQAATRADRAQTELRRGRAIRWLDGAEVSQDGSSAGWVMVAIEALSADRLHWMSSLGAPLQMLLTAERALALGLVAGTPDNASVLLPLPADLTLEAVHGLAAVTPPIGAAGPPLAGIVAGPTLLPAEADAMTWALQLAKRARLMPALLVTRPPQAAMERLVAEQLLWVCGADVLQAQECSASSLRRVSDAQVPIAAHDDCELVLFREDHGGAEHVAIIVGHPDFRQPVPVRLHSSCLTGDLLGSLRCDCGDQLRRAIGRLAESGGVLLYLEQEGRSIGLANKLRAYRLQDEGLDTLDADRYLGFLADERDYGAAVAMLTALGISRIRLLTNNPKKIAALEDAGIEVVERLALHGPVNPHNARYIETKQERAGHLKAD
ncbi:MAG: GTP cyclohydrolase II [Burkholderiaceae bacterium]|nr:GTP cyclohydrolase II [Burkholderiaceae bacterium]